MPPAIGPRGGAGRSIRSAGGWAGVAGSGALALHALLIAARPVGCVAEACDGSVPHRPSEDLAWLFLLAMALLTVALALGREPLRGWRAAALAAFAAATALLAVGMVVNGGSSAGSALWWLHDTDTLPRFLAVLGTGSVGVAALRSDEPRWVGGALLAAALLALPFNIQDWRVLLNLPLAAALAARSTRQVLSAGPGHRPARE